jgi:VCBS repeat-containing protein
MMKSKGLVLIRLILLMMLLFGALNSDRGWAQAKGQQPLSICTETARIMPLGDSITRGSSSGVDDVTLQVSYRKALYDSLVASGYSIDFVGSLTNGENVPDFDPQHEGHAGWTDSQIAQNIYNNGGENWLGGLGDNWPHIILLHIGTNSLDTSATDVENILNEIDEYENTNSRPITVILARIIDMVPNSPTLHTFNNNVQAMAEARTNDDIVIVDMEDGAGLIYQTQPTGDFFDNLHPYATGYTKMAAAWKTALDQVFLNCNNPPVITTEYGNQNHAENTAVSLDFEATDLDLGQTLSWSATNLPSGLSIDSGSGIVSGTIDYTAAAGSPYSTTVTVHDSGNPSASDTYSFTWTVTNANQPPTATADSYDTAEDTELIVAAPGVLENDNDTDGDTMTAVWVSDPTHGNLTLNGNGSFNYTPDENYFGTDSFTYKANDGNADSNVVSVTIDISGADDPPVVNNQSVSTDEDDAVNITLTGSDVDGDGLTFTVLTDPAHGTLSGNPPSLVYTPVENYVGTDSFTFQASDETSDSNVATVQITVNAVNDVPQVTNPGTQSSSENETINLPIEAMDVDGDALSYSMAGQPPDLQIDPDTGVISGVLSYESAAGSPYTVSVTVSDGQDESAIEFSWNAQNTNQGPMLSAPTNKTNKEGDRVSLIIGAIDPDGDSFTFSIDPEHPLPDGLSINPSTGLINGTVGYAAAEKSPFTVVIVATDEWGALGTATMTWIIEGLPRVYLPLVTSVRYP